MLTVSNPKPQHKGERIVSLTDTQDDRSYRYGVSWSKPARQYRVRAIDEGWWAHVHPADVPFPTAANIAAIAAHRSDGGS